MKILLCAFLLVLGLAGVSGAEIYVFDAKGKTAWCQVDEHGPYFPPGPDGICRTKDAPTVTMSCLAKTQAAMRAMDEFTPRRYVESLGTNNTTLAYHYCDSKCERDRIIKSAEAEAKKVVREQDAIDIWADTKAQCWGKP